MKWKRSKRNKSIQKIDIIKMTFDMIKFKTPTKSPYMIVEQQLRFTSPRYGGEIWPEVTKFGNCQQL